MKTNHPRQFEFETILERNDGSNEVETTVKVTAEVEPYAASVGFPEESSRGRVSVRITGTEHEGPPLSSDELEELESQAYDHARRY